MHRTIAAIVVVFMTSVAHAATLKYQALTQPNPVLGSFPVGNAVPMAA